MSWEKLFWSHHVHKHLGESLFYYFINVQPYDSREVTEDLERLMKRRRLRSLRAFSIFGRHDLIIRTWLHPAVAVYFVDWLDEELTELRHCRQFNVTDVAYAWYEGERETVGREERDLLNLLHEDNIRQLQSGEEVALMDRLRTQGLVHEVPQPGSSIKFFVTVNLNEYFASRQHKIASDIVGFCLQQQALFNVAVYAGVGEHCSLLVKAQSHDYFAISGVTLYINKKYDGVSTETFLCLERDCLMGDGRIGASTFEELKGRNLIVQGLVPEIYRREFLERYQGSERRSGEIVGFVSESIGNRQLAPKERLLVRDYLLSYLRGDPTEVMKVLFEFFVSLERFLRNHVQSYVGRTCPDDFDEVFTAVGAKGKEERKFLSLGSLIQVYEQAMEISRSKATVSIHQAQELVKLRNQTQHGALLVSEKHWNQPLETLLTSYQSVQELVSVISSRVSGEANARYF